MKLISISLFHSKRLCYVNHNPNEQAYHLGTGEKIETEVHPVDYADLRHQLEQRKQTVESIQKAVENAQQEIQKIDVQKTQLEKELTQLKGKESEHGQRLADLTRELGTLQKEFEEKSKAIEEIERLLKSIRSDIEKLEREIPELEKQIKDKMGEQSRDLQKKDILAQRQQKFEASQRHLAKALEIVGHMDLQGLILPADVESGLKSLAPKTRVHKEKADQFVADNKSALENISRDLEAAQQLLEGLRGDVQSRTSELGAKRSDRASKEGQRNSVIEEKAQLSRKKGEVASEKDQVQQTKEVVLGQIKSVLTLKSAKEIEERNQQEIIKLQKQALTDMTEQLKKLLEQGKKALKNPREKVGFVHVQEIENLENNVFRVVQTFLKLLQSAAQNHHLSTSLQEKIQKALSMSLKRDEKKPQKSFNDYLEGPHGVNLHQLFSEILQEFGADEQLKNTKESIESQKNAYEPLEMALRNQLIPMIHQKGTIVEPPSASDIAALEEAIASIERTLQNIYSL